MKEITKISEKELLKTLEEKRKAVREFKFGNAGSKSKDVKASRNNRKEIARILTELSVRSKAK